MRWFKISPWNSNWTIFDPLFEEKSVEYWRNTRFSLFSTDFFLAKSGWNIFSILILRPDLESICHFASLSTQFGVIFRFQFLTSHVILFDHECGRGHQNFWESVNFDELIVISVKNTYKRIHQFNIHRGVFELGLIYRTFVVLNRRNIQGAFFDKKCSK